MASKFKTITDLQYHAKVVHNLSQFRSPEVSKMIKKHSKIVDMLRKRMKSKGWCTA